MAKKGPKRKKGGPIMGGEEEGSELLANPGNKEASASGNL